jgi:hypothetical protein
MPSKVVIGGWPRLPKGTRVAFVPDEMGSRHPRMIEDATSPFALRSLASVRCGETILQHVIVKHKKSAPDAAAAR